jgi:phenylacetate-CoA ligase
MLEAQIRAKAPMLQSAYERMPDPFRNLLTSARGWVLARNRYSRAMYQTLAELRTHETWSREQVEAYQLSCLRRVLEHARRTVPFYLHYPQIDLRRPEEIARYPLLSREVVRASADQFLSSEVGPRDVIGVGTTGTTGANLKVAYTASVAQRNWAYRMRSRAWAGVEARAPRVTLFGSRITPSSRMRPPFWCYNLPERQILLSIFHLSEHTAPDYVGFLRKHRGKVLEGFPSVLGILADFVLGTGKSVPMRVVFTDGEPLYPFLRETIERAFGTRVLNLYGNTEACGLIHDCEHSNMHAISDYAYLEIVDQEGRPVAGDEEGYMVWTGFINETMPLIRYQIGDRASWQTRTACPCGRSFPLVQPTITRESDLLHSADGRIFSPRALNQTLKRATAFRFCQFVQDQPEQVMVRAVASNQNALVDLAIVRDELQKILGPQMRVLAVLSSEPIVRAGGKIPLIVQQTPGYQPGREGHFSRLTGFSNFEEAKRAGA